MSKSINQLENERKRKIQSLSLGELKNYIQNLHKKRFESFEGHDKESADFYTDKIKEIFTLTEGIYTNLDSFSDSVEIDILYSNLMVNKLRDTSSKINFMSLSLYEKEMKLKADFDILQSLMKISPQNDEIGEIIASQIKSIIFLIVIIPIEDSIDEVTSRALREHLEDKNYCIKKADDGDNGRKSLIEYGYLEALDESSEAFLQYNESYKSCSSLKNEVMEFINQNLDSLKMDDEDVHVFRAFYEVFSKDF